MMTKVAKEMTSSWLVGLMDVGGGLFGLKKKHGNLLVGRKKMDHRSVLRPFSGDNHGEQDLPPLFTGVIAFR